MKAPSTGNGMGQNNKGESTLMSMTTNKMRKIADENLIFAASSGDVRN